MIKVFLCLLSTLLFATLFHILFIDDTIVPSGIHSAGARELIIPDESVYGATTNNEVPFANSIEAAQQRLNRTKKVLFGYGQNCCANALKRLCDKAKENTDFAECLTFNQDALDATWVKQHAEILREWRGAGYWIWKPYLIHHLLNDDALLSNGDYLVYMDAGAFPSKSFQDMFEFLETHAEYHGVLFFGVGLPQKHWCKRDAYILQGCDEEKCWNAGQINAFLSVWRKGQFAKDLSAMWLHEATNKSIIDDGASTHGPELAGFREHRHDQAVITNIMNREGYLYGPSGWRLENYIVHDRYTF